MGESPIALGWILSFSLIARIGGATLLSSLSLSLSFARSLASLPLFERAREARVSRERPVGELEREGEARGKEWGEVDLMENGKEESLTSITPRSFSEKKREVFPLPGRREGEQKTRPLSREANRRTRQMTEEAQVCEKSEERERKRKKRRVFLSRKSEGEERGGGTKG